MHIVHRISLSTTKEDQEELSAFGVDAGEGFVTFEVTESHPKWSALALWIERRKPVDMVSTRFLPEELHAASWLEMVPSWHHGYPQPEEEFGYLLITYDLSQFCQESRIGAVQTDPF